MTDSAATQGLDLVGQAPIAILPQAATQSRVSADSFRRLTAMLKKTEYVPAIKPIVVPSIVVEPVKIQPPEIAVVAPAEIVAEILAVEATPPVVTPVEGSATEIEIQPSLVPLSAAFEPEPEIVPTVAMSQADGQLPLSPVEATVPEIETLPALVTPHIAATPEVASTIQPFDFSQPAILPVEEMPMLQVSGFDPIIVAPVEPAFEPVIAPSAQFEPIVEPMPLQVEVFSAPHIEPQPLNIEPAMEAIMPLQLPDEPEIQLLQALPVEATEEPEIEPPAQLKKFRNAKTAEVLPLPSMLDEAPMPRNEASLIEQSPEQEAEAAELARSLLDMMAQGSSAGQPQERALAADTLLRMLPRLPLKSRVSIAQRLCMMEQPPHMLVAKLITDPEVAVAGPLLEDCPNLTDEDLLRVISEREPAKRRMMARRRKISRPVTKALIETADPSALLTIARNSGAEIAGEGFQLLEKAAAHQPELLAPLCIRADLPVHFAFDLFWLAPAELRRFLLSRFLTDSETLTKILKIARVSDGDENAEHTFADPEQVKLALAQMANGNLESAAAELAPLAKLGAETIARILEDSQGEPLMALLKVLGFPRSQLSEVVDTLKTVGGGVIDPKRKTEELQSMFDQLSFNKARILVTYWDWSTSGSGPYAQTQ